MEVPEGDLRRIALRNAAGHGGRTRSGTVLSKFLGERPEYRERAVEVMEVVSAIVAEVNAMSPEEQSAELSGYPEDSPREKADGGFRLPPLEGVDGEVVTRFPPEPNGYPHIGHAKAAIINEEYVKMYGGRKILRMDDTNPESERLEYYAAIKVGLDWLGIKYDTIKNTSDDMDMLYSRGDEMIRKSRAYVCTCKRDVISRNRRERVSCRCSERADADRWEKMFSRYKPGEAVARYRGDMKSGNTVMRDPVIFRIIEARHPLKLDRYRVWPSYDFAVAIEDSVDGVTHAFRSKEYELRNELYYAILDDLGMRKPRVLEFSRLELEGMPVSKRVLRPLIEDQKVSWYDDPRLPTLEGLKRRGIRPEAVRRFIMSLGFTKADTLAPFESLEAFNRRIIDPQSMRLHMVTEPKLLEVSNLPFSAVTLANHPSTDAGTRRVELGGGGLLLAGSDADALEEGSCIRLIGLGNVRIDSAAGRLVGEYTGDKMAGYPKVHWVPRDGAHDIRIIAAGPLFLDGRFNEGSLTEADALVEPHFLEIPDESEVQFVRFGYCRKESRHRAILTHR